MSIQVQAIEPDASASSGVMMTDTDDEVHPDLLQPDSIPPSTISRILANLSISNILLYCVYIDCYVRLKLFTFSLVILIFIHPALSAIVSLTKERQQYT